MKKLQNIIEFENAINRNKRSIAKKKKSAPFIIVCMTVCYALMFNFSGHKLNYLFDNQLDFVKTISYSFLVLIGLYGIVIYFSIYKLSTQSKKWNKALYNLSKLDEDIVQRHQHSL